MAILGQFDNHWDSVAIIETVWQSLGQCDSYWDSVASDNHWDSVTIIGTLWQPLRQCGNLGAVWQSCLGQCGNLRTA